MVTLAGTLTLSALGAGVMQTDATGLVTSNNGTNGQLLIGGGTAPAWANITSTGATVTITNGPNTINLEATGGGGGVGTAGFFACVETTSGTIGGSPYLYPHPSAVPVYLGKSSTGILAEVFDSGSNFYPGNGSSTPASFTAPQTGKYFLSFRLNTETSSGAQWYYALIIETSNRIYSPCQLLDTNIAGIGSYRSRDISVYADMDSGDIAYFGSSMSRAPSSWWKIRGDSVSNPITWVCGYLVV